MYKITNVRDRNFISTKTPVFKDTLYNATSVTLSMGLDVTRVDEAEISLKLNANPDKLYPTKHSGYTFWATVYKACWHFVYNVTR